MVRHLRELGHEVTVVTTAGFGSVPGEKGVVRTRDAVAAPAMRKLLRAPELPAVAAPRRPEKQPSRALTGMLVPDSQLASWTPGAFIATRRLIRERRIDCLITSSPAESTHLIGLALGRHRPAWVADFRDGWIFEPWRPDPLTPLHRRLDAWLEWQVVKHAERISVVAPSLAEDFRRRLGVDAEYLPDGWDPTLEEEITRAPDWRGSNGRTTLVYTGKLWGPPGRDPSALFEALQRLVAEDDAIRDHVELIVAGPLDRDQAQRLERFRLDGVVRHVGHLPRAEALALQRRADVLVLLTSRNSSNITGKVWEYLAAGRPILALADRNAAAEVVRETRTGIAVPPDDVDAIRAALRRVLAGDLEAAYAPRNIDAYTYPAPALAAAELIERAIAARAR